MLQIIEIDTENDQDNRHPITSSSANKIAGCKVCKSRGYNLHSFPYELCRMGMI